MPKKNSNAFSNAVVMAQEAIRGILYGLGSPLALFIGLHNVFAHGEIFESINYGHEVSDDQLAKLFEHFDGLIDVMKKVESRK